MSTVLHLRRWLGQRSPVQTVPEISIRNYQEAADVKAWLELRHQAFARQRLGVRQWTNADFHTEFTSRWWWQPQRMWLAESANPAASDLANTFQPTLLGAVTLAMRGEVDRPEQIRPVVHWLMVQPRWRRRGIGRLLMSHLEAAAWDAGYRELWLETHAAWEAAVKFYTSLGYEPVH